MKNIMTVIEIRSDNVGGYYFSNNFILLIELLHVMFLYVVSRHKCIYFWFAQILNK